MRYAGKPADETDEGAIAAWNRAVLAIPNRPETNAWMVDSAELECACLECATERWARNPWDDLPPVLTQMFVCEICGNKRCPHSDDHRNACTGSNEQGQLSSRYQRP